MHHNISIYVLAALLMALSSARSAENSGSAAGPSRLHRIDPKTPQELQALFTHSNGPLPLVSAHRGGQKRGFPENCLATFEETLRHTFAIIEIDPRYTKDGAIVLHHDPTLERTTTGRGKVVDYTLAELKKLDLKDTEGSATEFQMPTLDEALEWARGRTVLVLDQKDVPVAVRVAKITEHKAEAFAMLIVNSFEGARTCHALNSNIMMEVMIPTLAKAEQFDSLGIPWRNVVAFVGHTPPEDAALYEFIHRLGARCMIGTSRNLDRKFITREVAGIQALEAGYRAFLGRGADLIETDIPVPLGKLLFGSTRVPSRLREVLRVE
jgi:glycerophosphoryl diester phosphodiesterase